MSDLNPLAVVIGYLWAVVVGGLAVPWVMRVIPAEQRDLGERWNRSLIGLAERLVAATATFLLSVELAAAWLVLKAAGNWGGWHDKPGVFNRFAFGTILSLAFGASGAVLAYALSHGEQALGAGAVFGPLALAGFAYSLCRGPHWWMHIWNEGAEESHASI